jgi:uncharacterized protein YjaG (DUF416 family)
MQKYDEADLVRRLDRLSRNSRIAFAAASAERLLPAFDAFWRRDNAGPAPLRSILDSVWADASGELSLGADIDAQLETCMALIPDDDDDEWSEAQPYAEDAASAVAYGLRTIQSGGAAQEAAWAARRAYEAVDHFVTHRLGIEDEDAIVAHPLMQAELRRQRQDLDDLAANDGAPDTIHRVRGRAAADSTAVFLVGH